MSGTPGGTELQQNTCVLLDKVGKGTDNSHMHKIVSKATPMIGISHYIIVTHSCSLPPGAITTN